MATDHLNAHGIDVAILYSLQASAVDRLLDADEAAALASGYNDYLADKWLRVDHRYRMVMVVAAQDPLLAAREIRRFGAQPGVVGIWVPPVNILLGNRYYFPIFEAADEVDLPIVLHPNSTPGTFTGAPAFAGGNPATFLEWFSGLPQLGMAHVSSLIFDGAFDRFPNLKVVLTEFGWTWVPSLLWRMDSIWKAGRASVPWVRHAPSRYVTEHIRFTSQPASDVPNQAYVAQLLEQMAASRTLLFCTDYPHFDSDEPQEVFSDASPELRDRIFQQNAVETFGQRLLAGQSSLR